MKNYYKILEVNETASSEVIEKAYKVLAKRYHPDLWPKDKIYIAENKFKEITEAYNVLSNYDLRADYDAQMGFDTNPYNSYDTLYNENQKLKQELNNIKMQNESQKYIKETSNNKITENNQKQSYIKNYSDSIKEIIINERKKAPDERSRDFKALILTVIIISILILIFWKVPFLNNLLFP